MNHVKSFPIRCEFCGCDAPSYMEFYATGLSHGLPVSALVNFCGCKLAPDITYDDIAKQLKWDEVLSLTVKEETL